MPMPLVHAHGHRRVSLNSTLSQIPKLHNRFAADLLTSNNDRPMQGAPRMNREQMEQAVMMRRACNLSSNISEWWN
jgi:phosphopantothenoylcysteine synthetase/decarboxylase